MKTWMRFGLGAAALALAVAIGTAAYAMRDDSSESPSTANDGGIESACLVGTVDCNDTPGDTAGDGGLSQTCLVGTPDCNDTPGEGFGETAGDSVAGMCAPGFPDCVDTVVDPNGEAQKCAADAVDCIEPFPAPDCVFTDGPTPEESVVSCPSVGCEPAPMPGEAVDPPVGAPEPLVDPAPGEPVDPAPETTIEEPPAELVDPIEGCLGADPCTISSEQMCPPPDCAVSSDGTTTCNATKPICAEPADMTEPVVCEDTVPPSEGEGSSGSGSAEPGVAEPDPAQ